MNQAYRPHVPSHFLMHFAACRQHRKRSRACVGSSRRTRMEGSICISTCRRPILQFHCGHSSCLKVNDSTARTFGSSAAPSTTPPATTSSRNRESLVPGVTTKRHRSGRTALHLNSKRKAEAMAYRALYMTMCKVARYNMFQTCVVALRSWCNGWRRGRASLPVAWRSHSAPGRQTCQLTSTPRPQSATSFGCAGHILERTLSQDTWSKSMNFGMCVQTARCLQAYRDQTLVIFDFPLQFSWHHLMSEVSMVLKLFSEFGSFRRNTMYQGSRVQICCHCVVYFNVLPIEEVRHRNVEHIIADEFLPDGGSQASTIAMGLRFDPQSGTVRDMGILAKVRAAQDALISERRSSSASSFSRVFDLDRKWVL